MRLKIKDPGSAITHFIGMAAAVVAATPLLLKTSRETGRIQLIALSIFIVGTILLYTASTIYHTLDISPKVNKMPRRMDHMMIFILIAGTYAPICMVVLGDKTGWGMLALVWGIALAEAIIRACWITCPKWFSSVIYIAMGWVCALAFSKIVKALPPAAFGWLLAGGIIYTVGGVIYAPKLPIFSTRHKDFGSHEIFHPFVMGGSLCYCILMYRFAA